MPSLSQLQTWLSEAYEAKHKIATGVMEAQVRMGDRLVSFSATNPTAVDEHIASLQQQISEAQGGRARRRVFRATQTGAGY